MFIVCRSLEGAKKGAEKLLAAALIAAFKLSVLLHRVVRNVLLVVLR